MKSTNAQGVRLGTRAKRCSWHTWLGRILGWSLGPIRGKVYQLTPAEKVELLSRQQLSTPGGVTKMTYEPKEQDVVMRAFVGMLQEVTKDGGKKRARGEKPPWWRDGKHEAAIWSHINRWKHGEKMDLDSKAHPLIHCAWRCLAIAWQETYGQVDPEHLV